MITDKKCERYKLRRKPNDTSYLMMEYFYESIYIGILCLLST